MIAPDNQSESGTNGHAAAVLALLGERTVEQVDPLVAAALRIIACRLGDDVRVCQVAGALGIHRGSLCRLFQRSLGIPVTRAIGRLRMHRAMQLLVDTRLPITEVADAVGYSSSSKMATRFREELGLSPTVYRRQNSR